MANVKRLREVVAWIEKQEAKHGKFTFTMNDWVTTPDRGRAPETPYNKNGSFSCGTNACLAGSAALKERMPLVSNSDVDFGAWQVRVDGEPVSIEYWAKEYFDLTSFQADEIFFADGNYDIYRMKSLINRILEKDVFPEASWTNGKPA